MVSLLPLRVWESKSTLLAHLAGDGEWDSFRRQVERLTKEGRGPRTLVLGLKAEAPGGEFSFSVASRFGQGEIGVIVSSGSGLPPAAVLMDSGRIVLVGHDFWITWVDVQTLAVVTSRRLDMVFYDFLPVDCEDEIVVVHELGALRVDANGAVKWSVDAGDIIVESSPDAKGNLILSVWGGTTLVVSLASGTMSH
jgi:hypothetical protein